MNLSDVPTWNLANDLSKKLNLILHGRGPRIQPEDILRKSNRAEIEWYYTNLVKE
jgi:hypothetical protein